MNKFKKKHQNDFETDSNLSMIPLENMKKEKSNNDS